MTSPRRTGPRAACWSPTRRERAAPARLGVDIGGTFTDIVLMLDDGDAVRGQGRLHAGGAGGGGADRPRRACWPRRGSRRPRWSRCCTARRSAPTPSCRSAGARCGPDHHARLSRRAGDRPHPHADMFDLRWDKPEPLVPRRYRLRGRRAHRRRRQRAARRSTRRGAGGRAVPRGRGHRRRSRSASSTATATRRTSARRRDALARGLPRPRGHRLGRRAARGRRVRAHLHHGGQRLRAAGAARLSRAAGGAAARASASRRRS